MIESLRIQRRELLDVSWENMVIMEFLRSQIALPFLSKKTKMNLTFGSLIISIMRICIIWWGKSTQEKRSSDGTQLDQRLRTATLILMKSWEDITHLQYSLSSESKMSNRSAYQLRHILPKKKQTKTAILIDNSFMFQVLLVPQKQRKSVSNISLETSKMQVRANWVRWSLINSMVLKHWLESFKKWNYTWKESLLVTTDTTIILFKISR